MNDNLQKALQYMFLAIGEEMPADFDGKKKHWYREHSWTEKQQEDYIEWLSNFLRHNWEGIADHKPSNYKDVAKEFVYEYGWDTRKLKMEDFTPVIPFGQLQEIMTEEEYKNFMNWMTGKTCSPYGVYPDDLERYLSI